MSHYQAKARHPETGKTELAWFIDDHFGRHRYGIAFADGKIFPENVVSYPDENMGSDVGEKDGENGHR